MPRLAALLALFVLGLTASAEAAGIKGPVASGTGRVTFVAALGEQNSVTVTHPTLNQVRFTDASAPLSSLVSDSGIGCSIINSVGTCTAPGYGSGVDLKDGDDSAATRNGVVEHVVCGDGADTVVADADDVVDASCETVDRPSASAPAAPDQPASALPIPAGGALLPEASQPFSPAAAPPAPVAEATPVAGRSVAVEATRGTVLVQRPGGTMAPLDPTAPIPVGAVIDARAGTVRLTAAADLSGRTQTADFTGGRFSVDQRRGSSMVTDLRLRGGDFAACPKSKRARAAARRRPLRRLWGSGRGRFRTHGKHAVATVRGTIWSVEDHCDGTLTRVERGVVEVRDVKRRRTKLVRKGQRHFVAA